MAVLSEPSELSGGRIISTRCAPFTTWAFVTMYPSVSMTNPEPLARCRPITAPAFPRPLSSIGDRKSTRLNSSHGYISYAVFCLKKKKQESAATCTFDTTSPNTHPVSQITQLDCGLSLSNQTIIDNCRTTHTCTLTQRMCSLVDL